MSDQGAPPGKKPDQTAWGFPCLCAAISALFVFVIITLGCQQFGGHDQGVLVDVAYRLYCGQRPYLDFPITQPILFYLGALWGLQLFGVAWPAFVYIAALFSVVTFALHLTLLRRIGISRGWSLSIASVVQTGAMVSGSFWWYNPTSTVAVCLLCTAAFLVLIKPAALLDWFLYAACLFLASLAKPNVAGIMIAVSSLALLGSGRTRRRGVIFSLLAACASLALLGFYRINPVDVLHSYLSTAGRGVPSFERFAQDQAQGVVQSSLALLLFTLLPLVGLFRGRPFLQTLKQLASWPALALSGGIVAGMLGCFTNGELKVVDLTMAMTPIALLCLTYRPREAEDALAAPRLPLVLQGAAMALLSVTALWLGVTRYRIQGIGPYLFYETNDIFPVGKENAFFARLECGNILRRLLEEITAALAEITRKLGRQPKVFFGPRMGWGYAAFHLVPPLHLPYSWWPGVDYPVSELGRMVRAFEDARVDYCFFLNLGRRVDTTYMPEELLAVIRRDYQPVYVGRFLVVSQRKAEISHTFLNGERPSMR